MLEGKMPEKKMREEKNKEEKPKSVAREIISWVIPIVCAVVLAMVLKNYVIINANVPTGSMLDTIYEQDNLLGFRLAYLFSDPKRGDIVIFDASDKGTASNPNKPGTKYIKRIIGEPGDKVVIRDAKIYINDASEPLQEDYLREEWVTENDGYEFQVPDGCYLMMGDNRNGSEDARDWEHTYVSRDAIIAKAWFIYYPFNHFKFL